MDRDCRRKLIANGGHQSALPKSTAQRHAVHEAKQAWSIRDAISDQLKRPAQFPEQSIGRNPLTRRLQQTAYLGITCDENAAFIKCEALAGGKAEEADVADGTCTLTLPLRAKRLRGILNDEGALTLRDNADACEIGNPS